MPIQDRGVNLRKIVHTVMFHTEYYLSGLPLINKDIFVNKKSSANDQAFSLYQDNPVPNPKRE